MIFVKVLQKNIVDVNIFVEKYNCWEWIEKEKINIKKEKIWLQNKN